MKIGSHVGMSGKDMLLGSAKEAVLGRIDRLYNSELTTISPAISGRKRSIMKRNIRL